MIRDNKAFQLQSVMKGARTACACPTRWRLVKEQVAARRLRHCEDPRRIP
jgi:hypothetical protein